MPGRPCSDHKFVEKRSTSDASRRGARSHGFLHHSTWRGCQRPAIVLQACGRYAVCPARYSSEIQLSAPSTNTACRVGFVSAHWHAGAHQPEIRWGGSCYLTRPATRRRITSFGRGGPTTCNDWTNRALRRAGRRTALKAHSPAQYFSKYNRCLNPECIALLNNNILLFKQNSRIILLKNYIFQ